VAGVTIQELGSLGDLIAAIATIATLFYLAIQIRQNTRTVRAASFQETVRDAAAMTDALAADSELSRIYWVGVRDLEALTPEERRRFGAYMLSVFRRMENVVYQTEYGALESDAWEGLKNVWSFTLSQPGGGAWWARAKNLFSAAFREYVEREFTPKDEPAA
jgi:hypothetical protein